MMNHNKNEEKEKAKEVIKNGGANNNDNNEEDKMTWRRALPQILATSAKNVILLGYGMTLGFPTIVIPSVMIQDENSTDLVDVHHQDKLKLDLAQISWFSSINLLCVPIGCALSGVCTQPFGRKKSMLVLNLPFILAWILYRYANSVGMLYLALAITGLTGGLLEAPVLTYVAEITEPVLRGILSATSSTCVILGVFLQFLMGTWFHWRDVAFFNIIFPLTAVTALLFVPESPHWLIGQGRMEEASQSLMWLRGWVPKNNVENELNKLKASIKPISNTNISCKNRFKPNLNLYLNKNFLHPFGLVTLVFAIGHLGGMTTLQTFAVSIFAEVGSPLDKYVSTVLLGLVQLLGAITCVALIRFTGKKPIAIISTLVSGALTIMVGINTRIMQENESNSTWLPLGGLIGSAFFSHTCIRLLPWILIGEVYPPEVRGTASGLSGGAGYILGFTANKTYLYLVKSVEVWGSLVVYGLISLTGAIALYFLLPETEGLTLSEIQDYFEGKRPMEKMVKGGDRNLKVKKNQSKIEYKERWAAINYGMEKESNM